MADIANEINTLLAQRRLADAAALCSQLDEKPALSALDWVAAAAVAQKLGDLPLMLTRARNALAVGDNNIIARLQEAEALTGMGQATEAASRLAQLERFAENDPRLQSDIANLYTHSGLHEEAARCNRALIARQPDDAKTIYNLAASLIALGEIEEATACLDRVIELNPQDYDAYYNRATLKKQTPGDNNIRQIEAAFGVDRAGHPGAVQLGYALAKELEDIGRHEDAFAALKVGADARKKRLSYNVNADVAAMVKIAEVYSENEMKRDCPGYRDTRPIFILGLPRSGTTLIDRILSSHSKIASLGEINDFALSMTRLSGQAASKDELIEKSARIDFHGLGRAYDNSTSGRGVAAARLIDKTPANFLYIGLIARALPAANIIHLRRNPMDSCYAIYKTLFRMGYPFSYDLDDLAQYYIAYHRLMDHWRRVCPDRIIDVDYENIVDAPDVAIPELIARCNLDWEDSCLRFYENTSAAATASAAQVRQPIYKTSVQKWRSYETRLSPLRRKLEAAGIEIDA